jgi:hypothetical protein
MPGTGDVSPNTAEVRGQVEREAERRSRLGVPAAAGGVLFLLSAIIANAVIMGLPSVGLLQGLEPALRGTSNPISPRAEEVRYLSHQALGLIAGSALQAIAVVALAIVLLFLLDCARFRGSEAPRPAQPLVIGGAAGMVIFGIVGQILRAIRAHEFGVGHDFSENAVEHALTKGTANAVIGYLGLIAPIAVMAGMIMVLLAATRAGLLTRWLRSLGIGAAVVLLPFFSAIFYLQLIPAAWLVSIAFMFAGRLPGGDPPAWAAGEARPWATPAEMRAARQAGEPAPRVAAASDVAPAPAAPAANGSSRKRRKRGARR